MSKLRGLEKATLREKFIRVQSNKREFQQNIVKFEEVLTQSISFAERAKSYAKKGRDAKPNDEIKLRLS